LTITTVPTATVSVGGIDSDAEPFKMEVTVTDPLVAPSTPPRRAFWSTGRDPFSLSGMTPGIDSDWGQARRARTTTASSSCT
jgi:hypothetical protein